MFYFLQNISKATATAIAVAGLIFPAAAMAQNVPSYAQQSYANGDQTIQGRIASIDGTFDITVQDDNGYTDAVELHQGTIINPTGLTLEPGMTVTIDGYNAGPVFEANQIDTPYEYSGARPIPVYYGAGWWYPGYAYGYGPSFSLSLVFGSGNRYNFVHRAFDRSQPIRVGANIDPGSRRPAAPVARYQAPAPAYRNNGNNTAQFNRSAPVVRTAPVVQQPQAPTYRNGGTAFNGNNTAQFNRSAPVVRTAPVVQQPQAPAFRNGGTAFNGNNTAQFNRPAPVVRAAPVVQQPQAPAFRSGATAPVVRTMPVVRTAPVARPTDAAQHVNGRRY
jgi:hypothetical protein